MGLKWFCDQCGVDLKNKDAVPMGIGVPQPEPMTVIGPMGAQLQVVQGPNGALMPYAKDPRAIFESFQLCYSCAYSLAILFKQQARRIHITLHVAPATDA